MKAILLLISLSISLSSYSQFSNAINIPDTLSGTSINLTVKDSTKEFITGKVTNTFSINESDYMGPTLMLNKGDEVSFNITNTIVGETITIHWHGFHIPAKWDGGPMNTIAPQGTWEPTFEIMEHATMMWYHSHAHGRTLFQVNKGIAGMIIIRDTIEAKLDLPRTYGIDDFPLIIQDKAFHNASGQIEPDLLGNVMLVNGTIEPFVELPAQVVRLRLINTSVERVFNIGFSDNRSFYQIGTDGGLLEAPVSLNRVSLAPGERAQILLDLTQETAGNTLNMASYSTEFNGQVAGSCTNGPGCGTGPLDATDFDFMEIRVVAQNGNPVTTIPQTLVDIDFIPLTGVDTTRVKQILGPSAPGQPFTIDGGSFDMNVINDIIPLGNREIWRFENLSKIAHPMHIHDVQFNIISRDGVAPAANENGWKDVVLVYPNETVEFVAEFLDFTDSMYTYMMHCHSLGHEDNGMMEQFIVVDTASVATGVAETDFKNFNVYPVPVENNLMIESDEITGDIDLVISNSLGQVLMNLKDYQIKQAIDVSSLTHGIYFLTIKVRNQSLNTVKFLKK
tara:strand:+ start:239 stop:1930 length:1692 start_codon:yes stop_codon:yes gene_type:complete